MNKLINKTFKTLCLLVLMPAAHAAEFCVTTSAGLQSALNSAAANSQHDVIKIAEGNYTTPGAEFSFLGNDSWDLEISGGWTEFFGNPCGQQLSGNAFFTTLDGDGSNRVLRIRLAGTADLTLSQLMLANGAVSTNQRGAGLFVYSTLNDHLGDITVEQVAFLNNQADNGAAVSLTGGHKVIMRNNLFVANHSAFGANVDLIQNDSHGIYFTNNTVYFNTNDSSDAAGVRMWTSGTSQALVANNLLWANDNHDFNKASNGMYFWHNNNFQSRTGINPINDFNNTSLPPNFDSGLLNFTPSPGSPLVNAGREPCTVCPFPTPFEDAWGMGLADLAGDPRSQSTAVDIGAIESPYERDLIFMTLFE